MGNKLEVVKISTNFSKFEESQEELIRGNAKREQMNWSNIFWTLLLPRLQYLLIIIDITHYYISLLQILITLIF